MRYTELGDIASHVGQPTFYEVLTEHIGQVVKADVQMVMRYTRSAAPVYVVHDNLDAKLMRDYLAGLYRIDPVYKLCKGAVRPGVFTLDSLGTDDREIAQYSKRFLSQTGMIDDLIVLFSAPASSMIGLVFERKITFRAEQVNQLKELFPLLAGLQKAHEKVQIALMVSGGWDSDLAYRILDKEDGIVFDSAAWSEIFSRHPLLLSHVRRLKSRSQQAIILDPGFVIRTQPLLDEYATAPGGTLLILEQGQAGMPPVNSIDAAESFSDAVLTPRERDIVRLISSGLPNAKIAEKLGLSINTIKNHRKRLYLKLDITTERELLLKIMEHHWALHDPRRPTAR